jgi:UDP-GlcNAc3NAcA epimerase
MKIATVIGARPQFVKAAAFSREVVSYNASVAGERAVEDLLIHTGQHFDANMSDVFFDELGMGKPKYQLDINGGGHGEMTGRMLIAIEQVLVAEKPDVVLVYGDTNSTLAGALAAVKMQIPVAHVEAGLRSFNMAMPEEINRILTDRISRWLFTPTEGALQHLVREGVGAERLHAVGDVMYDVALHYGGKSAKESALLRDLGLREKGYVLATVHRAENTEDVERLAVIVNAFAQLSEEIAVLWPMHPRTRSILARHALVLPDAVRVIDPVGYLEMVALEKHAAVIATDSGGVQKEAFFHEVPCVTLRDETEWVELVEAGWNRLAPPLDPGSLLRAIRSSIGSRGKKVAPYGSGDAARRILERLLLDVAGVPR